MSIDFFPSADNTGLVELLFAQKKILSNRTASSFLSGIFNKKLADLFIKQAKIPLNSLIRNISKQQILELCNIIKSFTVRVTSTNSFDKAQVCAGGVDTKEVNSSTLQSKLVDNLYFAGEILDVDGICGGYNLQWAWASGYIAGKSACEKGV